MYRNLFKHISSLAVTVVIGSFLFQSCREECRHMPESLTGVDFYSVINGSDTQAPVDGLSVYGLGREDSLLYSLMNNIRTINLPMRGTAAETGFVFVFGEVYDTVWFSHNVIPWFHSQECGFILNFELLGTRHTVNMIDSVVIVTKEITSFDDTNIRIYL
jgi:hypothetical protein